MAEEKKDETKSATATKERAAAAQGAEAVAAAVEKVAKAAVAEVQKTPAAVVEGDFAVSGAPGGPFDLLANSDVKFGASGTVTIGGAAAPTTEWSATRIHGTTAADNKGGEVVVHVDDKTQFKGWMKK